jgi:Zn-dependent membrane protease YugP
VGGQLSDHYDPRTHAVSLSDDVATQPSVAAMAIVAHELGHAQQHEQGSALMAMRSFLVPAIQFSPQIAYVLIFLGFILRTAGLIYLGALFYGVMVLFTVITLPVEIDASRRALVLLREANLVQAEQDAAGARQVLTAAAMTYLAAAVTAVLTLLYYLSLANRRR